MKTSYLYTSNTALELVHTMEPGEYPWHVHTRHWTAGRVLAGICHLGTPTGWQQFSCGSTFLIPPHRAHWLRVLPESQVAVLCVTDDLLLSVTNAAENILALLASHLPPGIPGATLTSLVTTCLHAAEAHPPQPLAQHLRDTFSHLATSPQDHLPLQQMAQHAGYSPWHFLRLFRKATGMTPHAYQVACRLRPLRALLRANTAIAEAAIASGFADQSHMHHTFKRHHGLTPRQFCLASTQVA